MPTAVRDELWGLPYKVSRDPIYSEIHLYPLELTFIDTHVVQRLRWLSQLCGAQFAYPNASHTRFAHSLGVMHLAGNYAIRLWRGDLGKFTVLRLAGLLHDIGHGPFSHQFDDVIFKGLRLANLEDHDSYRKGLISEYLPEFAYQNYKRLPVDFRESAKLQLEAVTGSAEPSLEDFRKLSQSVLEVYEGESTGRPEFNVVQGVLGADRLDFLLRDVYCSGTLHFGRVAVDRLIRNSFIYNGKLCYHVKVIDDIYSVLYTRYMMYKNVYFHKVGRAADLMIQEILKLSMKLIDYEQLLRDYDAFTKLTDMGFLRELELRAMNSDSPESERLLELIDSLRKRKLWKLLLEIPLSIPNINPAWVAKAVEGELIGIIVDAVSDELGMNRDELARKLKVDTPFRLTLVHPREFMETGVLLYDPETNRAYSFDEYVSEFGYRIMLETPLQLIRVYVTDDEVRRKLLDFIPLLRERISAWVKGEVVTRW